MSDRTPSRIVLHPAEAPMRACDYPAGVRLPSIDVEFQLNVNPGPPPFVALTVQMGYEQRVIQVTAADSVRIGRLFKQAGRTARYPDGNRPTSGTSFAKGIRPGKAKSGNNPYDDHDFLGDEKNPWQDVAR